MATIQLSGGKVALVDEADFEKLNKHRWYATNNSRNGRPKWYAARKVFVNGRRVTVYMHREVAKTPPGLVADHLQGLCDLGHDHTGDGLDNRGCGLKNITQHQNTSHCRFDSARGYAARAGAL
jgi:hypothetical protein